mmetsp:Transcript_18488/g.26097  ORF Transcript_18488/g.26097 Transcript_18488/m.26097 type:complete len:359 (-) Transcript_18488:111-1187(-)
MPSNDDLESPSPVEVEEDLESILITLGIFAIISVVVYYWILAPIFALGDAAQQPNDGRHNQQTAQGQGRQRRQNQTPRRQNQNQVQMNVIKSSEVLSMLAASRKCPSHVSSASSSRTGIGGSALLVDGMIPFRHGHAALYEQSNFDTETITKNRRDRARLLTRIFALASTNSGSASAAASSSNGNFSLSSTSPPSRGSTLVVSIPHYDVECDKLRRILFLLATYYNLLVIINFPPNNGTSTNENNNDKDNTNISEVIEKLRGSSSDNPLPEKVLPSHRILASQSVTGRIAVVRQLARVEFILDFDADMKQELNRFGFQVYIYGKELQDLKKQHQSSSSSSTKLSLSKNISLLGESLLP